ncbi:2-C-methyl-D-erythritol 4-phosphate cytidylyltransferase [Gemmatimonadota bacterium]
MANVGVAIPAAGIGRRMGGIRKPFLELAGKPVLFRSMAPFLDHPRVVAVAVALGSEDRDEPPDWLARLSPRVRLVEGGSTRGESVRHALDALADSVEIVAIHDAARPLLTREIVDRCLAAVRPGRGAVAGWPAVDTLKEVEVGDRIVGTPDRGRIWHAHTPQVFPIGLAQEAYRRAEEDGVTNTDDSALVERIGGEVVMVPGSRFNLKITTPEDLAVAELLVAGGAH